MNLKEATLDLMNYYKYVLKCKKCNIFYGTDSPKDNHICPICDTRGNNFKGRKEKCSQN
jgi:rubrerythrin